MSAIDRASASESVDTVYDGRSFLSLVERPISGPDLATTEPTYSSEGLLHCLDRQESSTATPEKTYYFYLAGRPVAQLLTDGTASTWTYLTTDHLGTPLMATDSAGDVIWQGPLEPFGRDWQENTASGALENGLFLRFPGQWDDGRWEDAASAAGMYYNGARWYLDRAGRYGRVDPAGLISIDLDGGLFAVDHPYTYARSNLSRYTDPLGLRVEFENPETADYYDTLKDCFPLFRGIARHFENDEKWFGLADRVWTVKTPTWESWGGLSPCNQGGIGITLKNTDFWVPPDESCEFQMECLAHEFYERYLIDELGFERDGEGGADNRARRFERRIPLDKCCPCEPSEAEE